MIDEKNTGMQEDEGALEVTETENAKKKEKSEGFSNFMSKTAVFGKKVASGIQKGAESLSEQTKKVVHDIKVEKYAPLFKDEFKSKKFKIPNVIKIVDDAVRKDIDVCEGAIGWRETVKGVEVLFLYDEFVKESKLQFFPFPKCDTVYCVDPFDRTLFVNADNAFERATNEKLAELENVAYCLGAKSCSVEIIETDASTNSVSTKMAGKIKSASVSASESSSAISRDMRGGKNVSYFEGNTVPRRPVLKWFSLDENIKGLIEMRCSEKNSIKSKVLELKGATSATMSTATACAIDGILKAKASVSLEKKSMSEHSRLLIFEVDF